MRHPGDTRENYERALEQATKANALAPTDVNILNSLGVAQYRGARYRQCIETLTRVHRNRTGARYRHRYEISDWAFIAMAYHRLRDHDAAQKALATARRIIAADKIEPG